MSRLEYAKLFFIGKKSDHMLSIERRFPTLEGFGRLCSFFHAFGNIGFDFSWGWMIILPARCGFELRNNQQAFHILTPICAIYYNKSKVTSGIAGEKK